MKKLVLITLVVLAALSTTAVIFFGPPPEKVYVINTEGQPTVGYVGAPVHVVIFEEPKCVTCKHFNDDIFPMIRDDYILTHKVLYTVIPVSFLPGSLPAATALWCVYNQDGSFGSDALFFTYLDYMYHNQPDESDDWATLPTLLQMARRASPSIDTRKLSSCIRAETYKYEILENTNYGQQLLGGHLTTPTVFVNGVIADHGSKGEMKEAIEKALKAHEAGYVRFAAEGR